VTQQVRKKNCSIFFSCLETRSNSGLFHYHWVVFSSQLKSKIVNILTKTETLRIILNIDCAPVVSRSHTHPSHSQTFRLLTSSVSLGLPVPRATLVYRLILKQMSPKEKGDGGSVSQKHPGAPLPDTVRSRKNSSTHITSETTSHNGAPDKSTKMSDRNLA
jgi:hypothetical protein